MEQRSEDRDLDALLEEVSDEPTFIAFVQALGSDFAREQALEAQSPSLPYGPGKLGWENGTVDAVFDAAAAWGNAKLLTGSPSIEPNPWRRCAHILYAGKFYE